MSGRVASLRRPKMGCNRRLGWPSLTYVSKQDKGQRRLSRRYYAAWQISVMEGLRIQFGSDDVEILREFVEYVFSNRRVSLVTVVLG